MADRLSALIQELLPIALQTHEESGAPVAEIVHALFWPHLCRAVEAELSASPMDVPAAVAGRKDRRAKPWQYVARFWKQEATGPELVGETDPEIMHGTGELPDLLATLGAQLHDGTIPAALEPDAVKLHLPQFRNNLGRANTATLRIPYEHTELDEAGMEARTVEYLCQIDVFRLGA